MANLSYVETMQFEQLFNMSTGYVLELSDKKLQDFFKTTANIDIFSEKYNVASGSKAHRMRAFWKQESDMIVGKVLNQLIRIWEHENDNYQNNKTHISCCKTANRLEGIKEKSESPENDFLAKNFGDISFEKLPIESTMVPIMQTRYKEARICLDVNASLSVIFLCGSILEGILLGAALKNSAQFTNSKSAPKDEDGKIIALHTWSLSQLIDIACEISLLGHDLKKFSHYLRDFRNYIHPYQQMRSRFNPDHHTAKICLQVLSAAVADLKGERFK